MKSENSKEYQQSQQQRYLERQIRNAKREKAMLENTGVDKEILKEAQTKISNKQAQLRDFIQETGSTRRPANEWVGV